MGEKNRATSSAPRDVREKLVARFARSSLDRHLLFCRDSANVCRFKFKIEIAISGEFLDESRISVARAATELMIQVADN